MFRILVVFFISSALIFNSFQLVEAQEFSIEQLPIPGRMVDRSENFVPLVLKGIIVDPQRPLEFRFIVDTGSDTVIAKEQIIDQTQKLVKYFLAGLTIPEGDLWVNLSPYEKSRMITTSLGQTELGIDLLAQDYILKQLTASLIYPEKDLGKLFWNKVYAKAQKELGSTDVPVETFNKVWILPQEAQVYENGTAAYVTKSTLKVMLDEDYLALKNHSSTQDPITAHSLASQVVREIVIPEITQEVNTGKNFASLRQIYNSMILAKWYKETIANGLFDALYTNRKKITGINFNDPTFKERIYQRYLQAYKKGVFNYIKQDISPNGEMVPRKYFSGGLTPMPQVLERNGNAAMISTRRAFLITVSAAALGRSGLSDIQNASSSAHHVLSESEFRAYLDDLNGQDGEKKYTAIVALGNSGDTRAVKPLIKILPDEHFSTDVDEALRKLGANREELADAFMRMAKETDRQDTKEYIVRRLGELGDQRAVGVILKLYDEGIIYPALKALDKLRADEMPAYKEQIFEIYSGLVTT